METAYAEKKFKFSGRERQPTALVAGGTGFLGSHLCEALVAQKFNVVCVDNLSKNETKRNISGLLSAPNFSLWEEDINKPGFTISPTIPLTHIFHLASVEEYLAAEETSLQTLLVNSLGTKNLLDLALEKKAKFILVSSTEVFHGALSQTSLATYFRKEADPTSLTFSEAKRFAESLTAEYFREYNLFTTITRIKDPYGPRMNLSTSGLLPTLIRQALKGEKIEVLGDGLRTLNPTYVTDIIFGVIKATLQGSKGEIFNLISSEKYTERAVAEHLKRIVGGVEIVYKKGEELELPSHPLIISSAEEKIGWSPKISLGEGLSNTVGYFRQGGEKTEAKEPILEKGTPPTEEKEPLGKRQLLRYLVFAACAALVFWTSILPPIDLAANIYLANKDLDRGLNNLMADKASLASPQASAAERSFKRGEKAAGRIWFAPFLRLREPLNQTKAYLFYGENLAAATKSSAEALVLVTEASETNISDDAAVKKLETAQTNIEAARRSLELAATAAVAGEKLPSLLKNNYQALSSKEKDLEELVSSLEGALLTGP
jgi:nucleoside-diphosphate-sugar epimerase